MSKPYTENLLSEQFAEDLIWRRRELSDLKQAIRSSQANARSGLLRALITLTYAHWEGFIRHCSRAYFLFICLRKSRFEELETQIYINAFLTRLDGLFQNRASIEQRCNLVLAILGSQEKRFSKMNDNLIDTKSNLNSDVLKDICIICGIDFAPFEDKRFFIDQIILKRRNAIAHGNVEFIGLEEMDGLVAEALSLMGIFKDQLENKVYSKKYLSPVELGRR